VAVGRTGVRVGAGALVAGAARVSVGGTGVRVAGGGAGVVGVAHSDPDGAAAGAGAVQAARSKHPTAIESNTQRRTSTDP
jgi:hypothetical protein